MVYIYELSVIYDFGYLIDIANQKFNDLYTTTRNKISKPNSFVNDIFDFIGDVVNQFNENEVNINNIIKDIQNKFVNQDFLNKIKEEIFAPRKNGNMLKMLDGNYAIDIINNLREKLPYFFQSNFCLLDIDFNLSFLNDYISAPCPLTTSLKVAFENFEKQSNENNYKIIFLFSDNEREEKIDEDTLKLIKYTAKLNQIYIFSVYLKPGKIEKELRFYDSYDGYNNLFSICSRIRYDDPVMNFFIQKGWELPSSGECKLFLEINDKQNLDKLVDLINEFTAELNNNKSIKTPDSIINLFGLTSINYHVNNLIDNFEAINQGKTKTCYANAISAAILLTLSKFEKIDKDKFIKLKEEIIEISKDDKKNTFEILKKISGRYKLSLNEVDEENARKAIMKTRVCVARFGLAENQWKYFYKFFRQKPKGILKKENLNKRIGKVIGHAVVLTHIYKDYLMFLNSYGTNWGDGGFFRVENAKTINAKFIEVFIEPNNFPNKTKEEFNDLVERIKYNISSSIF